MGPRLGPLVVTAVLVEADVAWTRCSRHRARAARSPSASATRRRWSPTTTARSAKPGHARSRTARGLTRRGRLLESLLSPISRSITGRRPALAPLPEPPRRPLLGRALGETFVWEATPWSTTARPTSTSSRRGRPRRGRASKIVCTRRLNDAGGRGRPASHGPPRDGGVDHRARDARRRGLRDLRQGRRLRVRGAFGPLAGQLYTPRRRARAQRVLGAPAWAGSRSSWTRTTGTRRRPGLAHRQVGP